MHPSKLPACKLPAIEHSRETPPGRSAAVTRSRWREKACCCRQSGLRCLQVRSLIAPICVSEAALWYARATAPSACASLLRINRQQINHGEDEHPDQVDEVPVQAADLDVFVLKFIYPGGDHK